MPLGHLILKVKGDENLEVIHELSKSSLNKQSQVLLIGKFDGVHIGHLKLIQIARQFVEQNDLLAIMSFSDYPLWVLQQNPAYEQAITPTSEKMNILQECGIDRFYDVSFTKEFASMEAEAFVLNDLASLQIKHIVVGEGFRFGKGGKGDVELLRKLCKQLQLELTVVPHVQENGRKISSTTIRQYITEGKVEAAQSLLGRPYSISGYVIHGQALGRTLGFPTANITGTDENFVLPKPGIYAGTVQISEYEHFNALISVGYRPTVNGDSYLIEAYLIDFSGDLYDRLVTVSFLYYMREEMKFSNLDLLLEQMNEDKRQARAYFGMNDLTHEKR